MSSSFDNQTVFQGIFSDGQTAGSQKVLVAFGERRLELRAQNGELLAQWVYHEITTIDHLHPGDATQIGIKDQPGARLYVDSGDFAGELISHLPHMSRHAASRRVYIPLLVIGVVLMSLIGGIWVAGYSIPQAIAKMIPDNVRKGMGRQVVAGLSGGKTACASDAGSKAFEKLLARIRPSSGQADKFDVQVLELGMLNAFAAPGERIVVSKKMINFVQSPEELAGVVAHEMGHGIKMHPEAGIVRALGISAGISIAFGGATGGFGDVGAMLLQLKYSRTAEFEADAIALTILKGAEIPAKPFAAFFARLEEKKGGGLSGKTADKDKTGKDKTGKSKGVKDKEDHVLRKSRLSKTLALLSTHPSSPERIAIIEKQPKWKTRPIMSDKEWQALRNICGKSNKSDKDETAKE